MNAMGEFFVPISGRYYVDDKKVLDDLKMMGASRVYASIGERFPFEKGERRQRVLAELKEKNEFYTSEGIEFAVWIDTLGFGGGNADYNKNAAVGYTRIRSIIGRELEDAFCPLDEDFTHMMCELVRDICRTGIRMLMLDDELCLSVRPGIGCACDLHMKEYCRRLGEEISVSQLPEKAFMGRSSRYRTVWMELMGDTLREFCRKIRAAVDDVDPSIRLGFCSGFTSWDLEGADALELTEILAGKNKPFLRLSGAPYWLANRRFGRQPLSSIIEFTRMQYALCRGRGIEVFAEADTYPRDRYHTPASYSECFDLALRASDGIDMLKYVYTYECQADYDGGYVRAHTRNASLRADIDKAFGEKECVGVRIYNEVRKTANAELPTVKGRPFNHDDEKAVETLTFNSEEKMLTANTVPTVYEGRGICGIAFGENARYLPTEAFENGLILDAKAAMILESMGIDVGLQNAEVSSEPYMECFGDASRPYLLNGASHIYRLTLKEGAGAISHFVPHDMYLDGCIPSAYTYENADGMRFLVYAFDAERQRAESSLFWSYERGRQLAKIIPWLGGKELPAICLGNPLLYQICKEGEGRLASAFINCHEDEIYNAEIKLSRPVKQVRFIGCEGEMISDTLLTVKYIKAFGFAAFEGELK